MNTEGPLAGLTHSPGQKRIKVIMTQAAQVANE